MKTTLKITLFILIAAIASCKKEKKTTHLNGGSIKVTNAIIGAPAINMMSNNGVISAGNTIFNDYYALMPIASGQSNLQFGVPAIDATPTSPAVPAVVYYNTTLTVDNKTNYSLFLTGTSTDAIDNVLIKESFQLTYADST